MARFDPGGPQQIIQSGSFNACRISNATSDRRLATLARHFSNIMLAWSHKLVMKLIWTTRLSSADQGMWLSSYDHSKYATISWAWDCELWYVLVHISRPSDLP